MPDPGGLRLKTAIHVARERAGIVSDMELARRSGVSYDTFMNWFGSRTVPRPAEVKKVADTLRVPLADLMAAYEGREPEQPSLVEAIRELVAEMRLSRAQQDEATMALLQGLAALAPRPTAPGPAGTRAGIELDSVHGR